MYKRIIIAVTAAILLFILGAAYHLAHSLVNERKVFAEQVQHWAYERTPITQIEEIMEYRGNTSYGVVIGQDEQGELLVAWLHEEGETHVASLSQAVDRNQVEQAAKQAVPDGELIHIVPGLDGEQRFWEVLMVDREQRYHYLYFDLFSGNQIKSYRVTPM